MSNTKIIMEFIDAWNRVDVDGICSFMSDDILYHNMPMDPINGLANARMIIEGFVSDEVNWIMVNIAEAGNVVLTERLDRFRFGDTWVELPVMGAFEVEDGKIKVWRDYFDMAQYTNQMQAIQGAT